MSLIMTLSWRDIYTEQFINTDWRHDVIRGDPQNVQDSSHPSLSSLLILSLPPCSDSPAATPRPTRIWLVIWNSNVLIKQLEGDGKSAVWQKLVLVSSSMLPAKTHSHKHRDLQSGNSFLPDCSPEEIITWWEGDGGCEGLIMIAHWGWGQVWSL